MNETSEHPSPRTNHLPWRYRERGCLRGREGYSEVTNDNGYRGGRGTTTPPRSAAPIAANACPHSPRACCRNRRIVGYHGESARPSIHRHSGEYGNATQTGTPTAPATWATAVSTEITKSR